jgi:hypothetical protein
MESTWNVNQNNGNKFGQPEGLSQFVFYVDNCSARNKNWVLYTAFTTEVNSVTGPDVITKSYLEEGHRPTFMSADSYYAKVVESAMRKMKIFYDYGDFVSAVERHGARVTCLALNDFLKWQSGMSTA